MLPSLVIVGLGNPGNAYANTRHNAGWMLLDALAKEAGAGEWKAAPKFLAETNEATIDGENILLLKPTTFMNRSGESVQKILSFYKLDPASKLLVVYDDIDLPLGTSRFRLTGGPGTHNGMKSIVTCIGENFPRFRIGLGPAPAEVDLANWILSKMTKEEEKNISSLLQPMKEAIKEL